MATTALTDSEERQIWGLRSVRFIPSTLSRKSRQASQSVRLTESFDHFRFKQLKQEKVNEQVWTLKELHH